MPQALFYTVKCILISSSQPLCEFDIVNFIL